MGFLKMLFASSKTARKIAFIIFALTVSLLLLTAVLEPAPKTAAPAVPLPSQSSPTQTPEPQTRQPEAPQPQAPVTNANANVPSDVVLPIDYAAMVVGLRDDWLYVDAEDVLASMRSVFAPEHHDHLFETAFTDSMGPMREALATAPTIAVTWYMTVPLTAGIIAQPPETSTTTVEVWDMQVFSRENIAEPYSVWSVHTLTLQPAGNSWLVQDWTVVEGPAPRLDGRHLPTTSADLTDQLGVHGRLYRDDMAAVLDAAAPKAGR